MKAEPLNRQAVDIMRAAQGEQHPDYAQSLNNLAQVYCHRALRGGRALHRQAADIIRAAQGEQHPDYAQSLNNLAQVYYATGRYAEAERLHRQAADIIRAAQGEQHLDYAACLNNIATLCSLPRVMPRPRRSTVRQKKSGAQP